MEGLVRACWMRNVMGFKLGFSFVRIAVLSIRIRIVAA